VKISRSTNLLMLSCALAGGLMAGTDTNSVADRIQAAASVLTDFRDEGANPAADAAVDPAAAKAKKTRSSKESMAIVTAGAAAGASIGAATKKGTQAIVVGAIVGGIAGLIYDRMTANKDAEAPPATDKAPATDTATQPEPAPAR
jgi:hypothetical protein